MSLIFAADSTRTRLIWISDESKLSHDSRDEHCSSVSCCLSVQLYKIPQNITEGHNTHYCNIHRFTFLISLNLANKHFAIVMLHVIGQRGHHNLLSFQITSFLEPYRPSNQAVQSPLIVSTWTKLSWRPGATWSFKSKGQELRAYSDLYQSFDNALYRSLWHVLCAIHFAEAIPSMSTKMVLPFCQYDIKC